MIDLIKILGTLLAGLFKSRAALQLENVALRHQINVLRRSVPKRISITKLDRFIFATLYRLWPKIVGGIAIAITVERNDGPYAPSRSRIRYCGAVSHAVKSAPPPAAKDPLMTRMR